MKDTDFAEYIAAFNRGDSDTYSSFYAEDVSLELGMQHLRGRAAIVAFYSQLRLRIKETLVLGQLIIGPNGIAAEMKTSFEGLVDWPDFIVQPIRAGEVIRLTSFVMYRVEADKFTLIRAARFRAPESSMVAA